MIGLLHQVEVERVLAHLPRFGLKELLLQVLEHLPRLREILLDLVQLVFHEHHVVRALPLARLRVPGLGPPLLDLGLQRVDLPLGVLLGVAVGCRGRNEGVAVLPPRAAVRGVALYFQSVLGPPRRGRAYSVGRTQMVSALSGFRQ